MEMDQDDVDILVPGREEEEIRVDLHAKEVKSVIAKIGITQSVLGLALIIGGIIISCSWPHWGVDESAEGVWCGVFVLLSGPLSIVAYFYLHIALVITCVIMNILSSLVLLAGLTMAAMSTFENSFRTSYRPSAITWSVGFMALNIILVSCFSLSVYITVIYVKILAQKKDSYCNCYNQGTQPNYTMVYVPTSAHVPEHMKNLVSGSLDPKLTTSCASGTLST